MATRTQIMLIDDLDGSPATETIAFSLDGVAYQIDLNTDNAGTLRSTLSPWITAARRTGGRRTKTSTAAPTSENAAIRAWAQANDVPVSARGRISAEVRDAWAQATTQNS